MTLKDFFTVSELQNGLTTPARVNDLITVMQNGKEYTVKNVSEANQLWSAVANTIATTENKECLDLFIQLDGLRFIDKWLNDAQKLIDDAGNGDLEELVIALLRALERLQVDQNQFVDSGVGLTVQGLLDHSSLVVREKAKDLCDKWAPVQNIDEDEAPPDVNSVHISPGGNINEENVEQPACSDTIEQETDKEEIVTQEVVMESGTDMVKVENDISESESTPATGASEPSEDTKEKQKIESLTTSSSPLEHETLTSNTEVNHALESVTKTETMEDKSDKDEEMVDAGEPQAPDNQNTTSEFNTTNGIGDSASGGDGGLQESSGAENPKSSSHTESDEDEKKDIESDGNSESHSPLSKPSKNSQNEDEKKDIESDDNSECHSPLSKPSKKTQNEDLISKRPSDMELDYGMVDPLELARQVAIEVELEVDSPEQSCSTSTNEKEHQSTEGLGTEVSSGPTPAPTPGSKPSPKGSPNAPEPMNDSETLNNPASQVTKMEESAFNIEKGFSGFDLNEDVCFDETGTDRPVDPLLTPIAVVSASRAAAVADGPPVAPLQFEGTLGWKGSAATSAFRRIPEGEKTFSSSSSHSNSNQRLNRFEFDLNVAESSEDKFQDFLSRDKNEEPSRQQLDLNSLGDSDGSIITLDWKRDVQVASLKQNRPQSPSVSSSMQPSFRNVDLNLNDQLTTPNNAPANNPFLGKLFNNKRDESTISLFGTQVEVNRRDHIPPPQPNGRILEPSVDFNLGRPGSGLGLGPSMPYSNLPAYGYGHNGFTMGPMYGPPGAPIPYMVDSRGAPIIPHIPPTYPQQTQPFFFNMGATGAPSGSNGAGPSRNTLDMNSGFITERGNRENHNGGLRQFFTQNQASSSSVIGGKRDQPDSGWDLFPINYKHQQPPWQ